MDFKQYKGKNIIAWLYYNANYESNDDNNKVTDDDNKFKNVCYVYPRVLINNDKYDLFDSKKDFPTLGRIEVRIKGGDTAEDICSGFGSLVNIKINDEPYYNFKTSNGSYDNDTDKNKNKNLYSIRYNPKYGKASSNIWIESFSGRGFYQIIDVNSNMEVLQKERSIQAPDFEVRTTLILLRCENKLYGPFECGETKEEKIPLNGMKDYQYSIGEYNALDYNDKILVIEDQNDQEALILIPRPSIPSPQECEIWYDWISEETLINSFIDSLRTENSYPRDQVRKLKEMVHQLVESDSDVQFTAKRILKIRTLLESIDRKERHIKDIVQYVLGYEDIKKILAEEIVNNYFDWVEDRISEVSSVQERVNELKAQEVALRQSIESLQESTEFIKSESSEEDKTRISELTQELEELRKENEVLNKQIVIQKEIEDLKAKQKHWKDELGKAKEDYDRQLIDNNDLKKQFEFTLQSFNDKAKTIARAIDSKLLDKILRGIGEEPVAEDIVPFDPSLLNTEPINYHDIIERVTDFIREKAHRDVTFNDVANYLICITQGFITTFAGEPGTGKTSLCNILAKALGLVTDIPQRRFVDISVERGWSSHKDFIGYYNPLSKKMERSNGEVFDAFERMDSEYDCDQSKVAPFIVLLDEANLSPIEHYWAAFLRNCDFTSVSNRSIPLGGTKSFKLPEHLRFLATVNFDHTTEELSPRFLDRSWVIMLEPTRIDDEIDEDIENVKDMVSFGAMKTAFCVRENDVIDEAIQNKWDSIQKIFRDRSLQIMPRNLKMVRNYCAVGCRCMECDTPATKFAPLDYALSQKILPTINGNGENYRKLVEDLLKECENMPISAKHLERMKNIAENNMGFYQFFSR